MKKIIPLLLFNLLFLSCRKGGFKEIYYLKIVNETKFFTQMSISSTLAGDDILSKYFILSNESFQDTSYRITGYNDGPYLVESKGVNNYVGFTSYSSYTFDNHKQTDYQVTRTFNCDTTSNNLCIFHTSDTLRNENVNGFEVEQSYYITFYITNQHYLLADSL